MTLNYIVHPLPPYLVRAVCTDWRKLFSVKNEPGICQQRGVAALGSLALIGCVRRSCVENRPDPIFDAQTFLTLRLDASKAPARRRNALTLAFWAKLSAACRQLNADFSVRPP